MADLPVEIADAEAVQPGAETPRPAWRSQLVVYGMAAAFTLLAGSLVFVVMGANPLAAYIKILDASLGSSSALALTLNKTTPLLLGGVAVAFALKAGYINLGVDGQIYVGATCATGIAFALAEFPRPLAVPAVLLAGALGGMVLGLVAGVLRARWGVNELFVTVMLSFVGFYLVEWVTTGPWQDRVTGEAVSRTIPRIAQLPTVVAHAHVGILGACAIALAAWIWLMRSRGGFEFRAVGANMLAARYAGIDLMRTGLVAMGVAGLIGGLAGAMEVSGVHRRLATGISPEYGLMAVLIAVLAKSQPLLVVPVSFAFGVLIVGSDALQGSIGLPASAVLLLQALLVLSVIFFGSPWFARLLSGLSFGGRR